VVGVTTPQKTVLGARFGNPRLPVSVLPNMAFLLKVSLALFGVPLVGFMLIYTYFGVVATVYIATLLTLFVFSLVWYGSNSKLSEETLAEDLKSLRSAYGDVLDKELKKDYGARNVQEYYTLTTDRDYKLLELFVGPGLHSRMEAPYPIGHTGGNTRQPAFILAEARAINAHRVLEIGCGRGHCSLFLAGAASDITFQGVDLTARHVQVACEGASRGGLKNVEFFMADARKLGMKEAPSALRDNGTIDLIFGVEALCHIDTEEGAAAFIKAASRLLRNGGRIVFLDGFRSSSFDSCSENQRTAMKLSECGYRIRAMPSKKLWTKLGKANGFAVVRDVDFTHEVIPFWELGWKVARVFLLFPWLVRKVLHSSPKRRETAANLLSVATTAHAMRQRGSAEYGMLVLEKRW
jgi:SAM-dependent methyltransferase